MVHFSQSKVNAASNDTQVEDIYSQSTESTPASSSATEDTRSRTEAPPAKRLKGLAAVLQFISNEEGEASPQPTLTPAEKIDKEIKAYLDLHVASSDTDPSHGGEWNITAFLILLKWQESIFAFVVQVCHLREYSAQLGMFVLTAEADCYPRT